jgi:D-ribulokinase
MVPGLWLNEGGQSAAGAAIDHLVLHHPSSASALAEAKAEGMSLPAWLAREAARRGGAAELPSLVGSLHVVPEFLGNRSPFADPDAKALIAGLGMRDSVDSLIGLYLAGIASLGYGLRQIMAAQSAQGAEVDMIVVSGGAGESALVRQILADAAGVAVAQTVAAEPVLVGAAMLGALAFGAFPDAPTAMARMSELGEVLQPSAVLRPWHDRRSGAFERLQAVARTL